MATPWLAGGVPVEGLSGGEEGEDGWREMTAWFLVLVCLSLEPYWLNQAGECGRFVIGVPHKAYSSKEECESDVWRVWNELGADRKGKFGVFCVEGRTYER